MVSHPDARPARAATSVSSSRHPPAQHRRRFSGGRSHHGGSCDQPRNEFPVFSITGDVEVVIRAASQERKYLLHRLILAQNSGFFDAGTSEEWPAQRGDAAGSEAAGDHSDSGLGVAREENASQLRAGRRNRWRYELDWENREDDELPILVQKTPTASNAVFGDRDSRRPPARNKPPPPSQGFFRSMANLSGIQSAFHLPSTANAAAADDAPLDPIVRDYDNLFRIFYNHPPALNAVNIASAYAECKSLLHVADMYDALPVVGPRVDHHLLRFSSRLYKQIAKYPPSYLKLGYLARSRVIFAEALIHVVGQWPAALPHLGPNSYSPLPDAVLDLIEDKVDDLEDLIARTEGKLFRLTLTTSRGERVSPNNAYLDWLAVSLFRQFLVENTTPPPAPILKNSSSSQPARNIHSAGSNGTTSAGTGTSNSNSNSASRSTPTTATTATSTSTSAPSFSIGRTYRLLGSSNPQAYLSHDELKRFLKMHPSSVSLYSRDSFKRFERKMDEIKRLAREIVKPLMRNFLELDLRGGDDEPASHGALLPYLTCTRVELADFPWD
ncbi:hypothetical protein LOZ52_000038 [Ophidiomyces ophidiicola]|uniref:uncharacterized protein n=1 Tax=Ophidiomyces ophidiicola TaxID=1387563 RepID=UPI0020C2388B|nr:uncharacterized protein LOZ57_003323 [Ophidiomyces ophidiicola]KAI1947085.1 hypothetical protein LOZ57_003323 [Ophidiomyces ophidiicola]KAI1958080.1 hypothetical protein LOZ59_003628 [Ophidiomyces ophidiicola]KAI2144437.1 hypothetical protein LOZ29_000712 [Ophidiomyces ophidiicola]KAI2218589.1 hypothetical protein LOZ15_003118 [Ophidiomyces ophidiicola]KAI2242500.1 hypothetical protein LOZ13_002239 [Ophidiomyces ophidiicola]